jgi:hypothetical protein
MERTMSCTAGMRVEPPTRMTSFRSGGGKGGGGKGGNGEMDRQKDVRERELG